MAKRVMTQAAQVLLEQALHLTPEERATIAAGLDESLHSHIDPEIEAAWVKEVEARIDAHEAGEIKSIPIEDVFKLLKK